MNIYICHSKELNYDEELYNPILKSNLIDNNNFILPHLIKDKRIKSKEVIKNKVDIVISEITFSATGMGIELGWADSFDKKIYCIYKKNSKISNSLKYISNNFYEYNNNEELIKIIQVSLRNFGTLTRHY